MLGFDALAKNPLGVSTTVVVVITFPAGAGSFAVAGQAATLAATRRVAADAGSLSVSGSATLRYDRLPLRAEAGQYLMSGKDAALRASRVVSAAVGAFTVSSNQATLRVERYLAGERGSFEVSGKDVVLRARRVLLASASQFTITGYARLQQAAFFYGDPEIVYVPWEMETFLLPEEYRIITLPSKSPIEELLEDRVLNTEPRLRVTN